MSMSNTYRLEIKSDKEWFSVFIFFFFPFVITDFVINALT